MITEQVITYIKDQLTRGISRDKIRSNLLAAGWIEEDVNQAFSFAEPAGQSAAVAMAPAFAVREEISKEIPVDKSSFSVQDPFIPILKKDIPVESPIVSAQPISMDASPMASTNVMPGTVSAAASPISTMGLRPSVAVKPSVLSTFGDDGEIKKPKTSRVLKSLAIILFLILLLGNAYIWMVVLPTVDTSLTSLPAQNTDTSVTNTDTQMGRQGNFESETTIPAQTNNSPAESLRGPVGVLQNSAAVYFSANNSYGTAAANLAACQSAGGVFTDAMVKKSLNDMAALAGATPKCSLAGDDPAKKTRMTSYLVYIPMGEAGYCADSTGASFAVSNEPTGTFCADAI